MVIMTLFQLMSVPVFLKFWGVEMYGEWMALNTLTAYFQMTDIGLNTATGNSFTFNYLRKDFEKCNILINNNIFFIIAAFSLILIVVFFLGKLDIFINLFKFTDIENNDVNVCIFLLFLQVMIGTFNNLLNTFYTATSKYFRGIMIDNLIRISEYISLILGVILQFSIVSILILCISVKFFGLIFKYYDSNRFYKLQLSIRFLRKVELKEIFIPALSFFSFPVSNSLTFQGVTLLINFFLGSVAVVIFNTTRTLVNFCKATIDILHKSVWPEVSISYGNLNLVLLRKTHYRTILFSFLLAILTVILMVIVGPFLYVFWTKGTLVFDSVLFYLLLISLITNALWSASSVLLQATNNHKEFSVFYLFSSILAFLFTTFIVIRFNNITLIPISMLLVDFLLLWFVFKKALKISEDNLIQFKNGIFFEINDFIKFFSKINIIKIR